MSAWGTLNCLRKILTFRDFLESSSVTSLDTRFRAGFPSLVGGALVTCYKERNFTIRTLDGEQYAAHYLLTCNSVQYVVLIMS